MKLLKKKTLTIQLIFNQTLWEPVTFTQTLSLHDVPWTFIGSNKIAFSRGRETIFQSNKWNSDGENNVKSSWNNIFKMYRVKKMLIIVTWMMLKTNYFLNWRDSYMYMYSLPDCSVLKSPGSDTFSGIIGTWHDIIHNSTRSRSKILSP